jgi:hypothetical protein
MDDWSHIPNRNAVSEPAPNHPSPVTLTSPGPSWMTFISLKIKAQADRGVGPRGQPVVELLDAGEKPQDAFLEQCRGDRVEVGQAAVGEQMTVTAVQEQL